MCNALRLIIVRIRFRASDFGLVAKIKLVQNRNRLLVRRWCSGHRFFARVIQELGFGTQRIQANVDYCFYVRRSAECASLGPGLKHPSLLSDSSLAAKRRAEALHVVFVFNKASEPSTSCCSVCTLVRYVATKDTRWVRCSPCSLGPSPSRPTASCSLAAVRRGDCVGAS